MAMLRVLFDSGLKYCDVLSNIMLILILIAVCKSNFCERRGYYFPEVKFTPDGQIYIYWLLKLEREIFPE